MRILLINPPGEEKGFIAGTVTNKLYTKKPLGILHLAAFLMQNGFNEIKVFDLNAKKISKSDFERELITFKPNVVGITVYTILFENVKEIINIINKVLVCEIVLGGPHATFRSKSILNELNINYIIRNEGESTFLELLHHFKFDFPVLKEIQGLTYKNNHGKVIYNKKRDPIKIIETLPFPLYLDDSSYTHPFTLITSRGCIGKCIFCSNVNMFGQGISNISGDAIFDRFIYLCNELNKIQNSISNKIYIEDSCFTANKERVERFCELKINSSNKIHWECLTRLDCLDKNILNKMNDAGCDMVLAGIESTHPKVQNNNKKIISADYLEELLEYCNKLENINLGLSFIIGLPGETKESLEVQWKYIKYIWRKYSLKRVDLNCNALFPGTYQDKNKNKLNIKIKNLKYKETSRTVPNVYTDEFTIDDLNDIMKKYIKELIKKNYEKHFNITTE